MKDLMLKVGVANISANLGSAAAECVSDEALVHLKSYKYSSVDKSLISNYILKHYVCPVLDFGMVELQLIVSICSGMAL
jgi:hypothetical protein